MGKKEMAGLWDRIYLAPWIRLRLLFCGPGFESQAFRLRIDVVKYFCHICHCVYDENKPKETDLGQFLKK